MKLQFSTASLLLATTFIAIAAGGMVPFWQALAPNEHAFVAYLLEALSPVIIPFLFVAFALGRRALTVRIVIAFAIGEGAAIALWFWRINNR